MVWIDNILDLEFYNASTDLPCYGDTVFSPSDIILQGQLPRAGLTIIIKSLSVDGLTVYGTVTSYFDYYIGLNTDGIAYFNIKLREWPDAICSNGCFILEVIVSDGNNVELFHKYTQKYVVGDCSTTASGVTVTQDGNNIGTDCASIASQKDNCQRVFKQLFTIFNCIDQFTGDYYGLPVTTYMANASPYKFYKSSWIEADVFYDPLEIKRTTAINCRLQKVEKKRQWILIGLGAGAFSLWKVIEIENQLMSDKIYFNGKLYAYDGDKAFQRIIKEECRLPNHFKLRTTLNECYEFQIMGCSNDCG